MTAEKKAIVFVFRSQLSKGNLFLGHDYRGQHAANYHKSKQETTQMPGKQSISSPKQIQISGSVSNSLKEWEVLQV